MADHVLMFLTFKSVDTTLRIGGSQSWVLDKQRAKACKYAVLCRNAHHPLVEGPEDHGAAFLVGLVKDIIPSTENDDRWLVTFSEYALCDFKDNWEGRNPVSYWTTKDFLPNPQEEYEGIDFDKLNFLPMPEPVHAEDEAPTASTSLTFAAAKAGLARSYNVSPSAIEIVIRG